MTLLRQVGSWTKWEVSIPKVALNSTGRFAYDFQLYQDHRYKLELQSGATSPVSTITITGGRLVRPQRPLVSLPLGPG